MRGYNRQRKVNMLGTHGFEYELQINTFGDTLNFEETCSFSEFASSLIIIFFFLNRFSFSRF